MKQPSKLKLTTLRVKQYVKDVYRGVPTKRSPQWQTVRWKHFIIEPRCQFCGSTLNPECHHIQPFHKHPELELEPSNLITLCEDKAMCHLKRGHLGSYKNSNVTIREECAMQQRLWGKIYR